ncbi:hypothetical protein B0A49_03611 [Cryomyces minteri]|uniref:N-acetyltransferase domain-containing protein n=1 Tax=Cryomyces minteri TaxID=331657 RepID=A0A4U0XGT6_9PEZI|nr:hypothetical protein B0A49_03611 [Cryomyces minteri]
MTELTIHPLDPSDIPAVADIGATAMHDDELFTFLCPHRDLYPSSFRQHFVTSLKKRYHTPDTHVFVAKTGGTVVGYAVWSRERRDIELSLLAIEEKYTSFLHLDSSLSYKNLALYNAHLQKQHEDPVADVPECWSLEALAVVPAFQRHGIGSQLLAWGMQQAREERVPVTLEASQAGLGLQSLILPAALAPRRNVGRLIKPLVERDVENEDMEALRVDAESGCSSGVIL